MEEAGPMSRGTPDIEGGDGGRARRTIVPAGAAVAAALLIAAGCGRYRIEYHERPGFYEAAGGAKQERVTLDDGTVLIYRPRQTSADLQRASGEAEGERFEIREEKEDGTVVLRALLPEHVLANTLTCLRNEEYDLLWEQMLSAQTRRAYELRGQGYEEYKQFFSTNRNELAATLTRITLGLSRQESYMENIGGGVIRFRLHPRVASAFKFKTADVVAEDNGLKLLIIR